MSSVSIKKTQYGVFGNCVEIENGKIKLVVTLDFGPRVIHCSIPGKQNMFYNDEKKAGLAQPFAEFGGDIFRLYGGHRLWISPEVLPRCYAPDNKPVAFTQTEYGGCFTAPVEEGSLIQKSFCVTMADDEPSVTLEHTVKNCGMWEAELAPWAITMFAPGAKEVVPRQNPKAGLLPNGNITTWDYTNMACRRVHWGRNFITLYQDKNIANPIKFGVDNRSCWAAVFVGGQVLVKSFDFMEDALYPDNGCNFETYTNGDFLECESLGPLTLLDPGETLVHEESWEIFTAEDAPDLSAVDEDKLAKTLEKYI